MVVSELRGEKIDIIPFNEEPARFVAKALSPARVREVLVDDENKQATVIVPDDQLSLAIGKEGQNARLAARLTGWRVDIRSETEFAEEEQDMGYDEEDFSGRCAAILSNGKRCPNAALPGSKYCGVPAHQELALHDVEDEEPVVVEHEPELEALADALPPDAESVGPSLPDTDEVADDVIPDSTPPVTAAVETDDAPLADGAQLAPPAEVPAGIPVEEDAE
jgi:N utilization substance protein A